MKLPVLFIFLLCCAVTFSVQAQPDTIYIDAPKRELPPPKSRRELRAERKYLRRIEDGEIDVKHAILFEPGRLISLRFPSMTFSYHRFLGKNFSAVGSVGLPINRIDAYAALTGPFSGIEGRVGGKVFFNERKGFRYYFSFDAWVLNNTVKATAFVEDTDLPILRAQELKLNRKRQMVVPSFGFQSIEKSGLTIDCQLGIVTGRRGIFSEGGVSYLSDNDGDFFNTVRTTQNEWSSFFDLRFGFSIGYAF